MNHVVCGWSVAIATLRSYEARWALAPRRKGTGRAVRPNDAAFQPPRPRPPTHGRHFAPHIVALPPACTECADLAARAACAHRVVSPCRASASCGFRISLATTPGSPQAPPIAGSHAANPQRAQSPQPTSLCSLKNACSRCRYPSVATGSPQPALNPLLPSCAYGPKNQVLWDLH